MKKIQKLNQDTSPWMKITVTRKMMKILKTERIRSNLTKVENHKNNLKKRRKKSFILLELKTILFTSFSTGLVAIINSTY
jgi:hypothetical protein